MLSLGPGEVKEARFVVFRSPGRSLTVREVTVSLTGRQGQTDPDRTKI